MKNLKENFKKAEAKFNANPNAKTAEALSEARQKLEKAEKIEIRKVIEANKTPFMERAEKMEREVWAKRLAAVRAY